MALSNVNITCKKPEFTSGLGVIAEDSIICEGHDGNREIYEMCYKVEGNEYIEAGRGIKGNYKKYRLTTGKKLEEVDKGNITHMCDYNDYLYNTLTVGEVDSVSLKYLLLGMEHVMRESLFRDLAINKSYLPFESSKFIKLLKKMMIEEHINNKEYFACYHATLGRKGINIGIDIVFDFLTELYGGDNFIFRHEKHTHTSGQIDKGSKISLDMMALSVNLFLFGSEGYMAGFVENSIKMFVGNMSAELVNPIEIIKDVIGQKKISKDLINIFLDKIMNKYINLSKEGGIFYQIFIKKHIVDRLLKVTYKGSKEFTHSEPRPTKRNKPTIPEFEKDPFAETIVHKDVVEFLKTPNLFYENFLKYDFVELTRSKFIEYGYALPDRISIFNDLKDPIDFLQGRLYLHPEEFKKHGIKVKKWTLDDNLKEYTEYRNFMRGELKRLLDNPENYE